MPPFEGVLRKFFIIAIPHQALSVEIPVSPGLFVLEAKILVVGTTHIVTNQLFRLLVPALDGMHLAHPFTIAQKLVHFSQQPLQSLFGKPLALVPGVIELDVVELGEDIEGEPVFVHSFDEILETFVIHERLSKTLESLLVPLMKGKNIPLDSPRACFVVVPQHFLPRALWVQKMDGRVAHMIP